MGRDGWDLRLLECLRVLVEERHVSRAADRLGTSQPTLSSALSRLRRMTGDPLLIRTAKGMVPTQLATELAAQISEFFQRWDGLIHAGGEFDPTTGLLVTIQITDGFVPLLIAPVLREARRLAPLSAISIAMPSFISLREKLELGDVDMAIGIVPELPNDLYISRLQPCYWRCIASADHPRIGATIDLADFTRESHAVSTFGTPTQLSLTERNVQGFLDAHGLSRQIGAYVPTWLSVPDLVATSDLIAIVPQPLAESAAQRLPLKILMPPVPMPPHELALVWHARTHNDPGQRWFRNLLRAGY